MHNNGWMLVTLFYMASISSIILDTLNERGAFAKCAKLSTYEQDEGNML
jgi:allantoicase